MQESQERDSKCIRLYTVGTVRYCSQSETTTRERNTLELYLVSSWLCMHRKQRENCFAPKLPM